jgi:hypothetical protein
VLEVRKWTKGIENKGSKASRRRAEVGRKEVWQDLPRRGER